MRRHRWGGETRGTARRRFIGGGLLRLAERALFLRPAVAHVAEDALARFALSLALVDGRVERNTCRRRCRVPARRRIIGGGRTMGRMRAKPRAGVRSRAPASPFLLPRRSRCRRAGASSPVSSWSTPSETVLEARVMYNHGDATPPRLLIKPKLNCRLICSWKFPRTKLCPSLCVGLEGNSASHQHACGPGVPKSLGNHEG